MSCPSIGCLPNSCFAFNHDAREQSCFFGDTLTDLKYQPVTGTIQLPGRYSPSIPHTPTSDCRACRVMMDYLARQMLLGRTTTVELPGSLLIEAHPGGQAYIVPRRGHGGF